jgi:hypothetical protein
VLLATSNEIQFPGPASLFTPTSLWTDMRGNDQLHIYGGSAGDDATQGELYVWVVDMSTGNDVPGYGMFPAPEKTGPLTLTSVLGNAVSFSYSGGQGTLDLGTKHMTLVPS